MGEVEGVVVAEIRFEVPDGMLESLSVGEILSDSLLNQSRFAAQNIPMRKSMGRVVAGAFVGADLSGKPLRDHQSV